MTEVPAGFYQATPEIVKLNADLERETRRREFLNSKILDVRPPTINLAEKIRELKKG